MREQTFETMRRGVDLLFEALAFADGARELLSQLLIIRAQTLAELDELSHFAFECRELRIHEDTIVSKIQLSQLLTSTIECNLAEYVADAAIIERRNRVLTSLRRDRT